MPYLGSLQYVRPDVTVTSQDKGLNYNSTSMAITACEVLDVKVLLLIGASLMGW